MIINRSIHTKPNNGLTNEWLTPPEILEALGPFDLDPCSPANPPWPTATQYLTRTEVCTICDGSGIMSHGSELGECRACDGLTQPWRGRVWLNPPYGSALKHWLRKMAEHGNGIALVPARTEVESWFWPYVWEAADAVLFLRGRLFFRRPDGSRAGNAGHGSVLVAYGKENATVLQNCGIVGKYIELKTEPRPK